MADSLLPVNGDYTDKDFDSARLRLFTLIQSVFPTWTDTSVANFGNILVEMFAWCMDILGFYQDNQALESRIVTATQRKSLIALAKLVNYEPASARAAQGLVKFIADPPPVGVDTVVLGGMKNPFPIVVKSGDAEAVDFELQQQVTLTNGAPEAWATVENSEERSEVFQASGFLGQEITLSRTPYLDGTAVLTAGNGSYAEVSTFLNSTATDRHFTVEANNAGAAIIRFGNQVQGQLPSGTISVIYKTGGGSRGNLEPGSITQIPGSFQTESGQPVTLRVTNETERTTGGDDRESEAQIRENAPLSLRVLTRAVCREDFEILAIQRGGMARALMLTNSEDGDVPLNTGFFYLVPSAARGQKPGFLTAAKQDAVIRDIKVNFPWPTSFDVQMRTVSYLDITIRARVFLRKGYSRPELKAQAVAAMTDYFALYNLDGSSNNRVNFGFYYETGAADNAKVLPLSDLQNALRDCVGVHRLGYSEGDFTVGAIVDNNTGSPVTRLVAGSHMDIPIRKYEFPRFDSNPLTPAIVLVDGATGEEF